MKSKKINFLKIITSSSEMQKISLDIRRKDKKKISLVPTMGALHDGHLSLVRKAKMKNSIVIVTIFINPIQFNNNEDLKKYPSSIKKDIVKLEELEVDYLFVPKVREIYPDGYQTKVSVSHLKNHLCGLTRDGHFDGVTSVVLKLFNLTIPDYSFFGEKDLQQLIIIRQMVKDLNLPIKVISNPIVREKNGLAMSSRNIRLSKKAREIAPLIYTGLKKAREEFKKNNKVLTKKIIKNLREYYASKNITHIEYIEIINPKNFSYPSTPSAKDYILVAIKLGSIRLIDNLKF